MDKGIEITSELVGRDRELAVLDENLKEVFEGHGRTVFIKGSMGLGKTRLVREWYSSLVTKDVLLTHGVCPREKKSPYTPFLEALGSYFNLVERLGKVDERMLTSTIEERHVDLVPNLTALTNFLCAGVSPVKEGEQPRPTADKYRLFEIISQLLDKLSESRPLVIFIDDFHFADEGTLNLFQYISRRVRDRSVLIIAAYRVDELYTKPHAESSAVVETIQRMSREHLYSEIELAPLSKDETEGLIDSIFEKNKFNLDFFDFIYEKTNGVPLYIMETLRMLLNNEQIQKVRGYWSVPHNIEEIDIPANIRDIIKARMSRLDGGTRQVIECASVIGTSFDFHILQELTGMGEEDLVEAIESMLVHHIIMEAPGKSEVYTFTHTAVKDTAYDGIEAEKRKDLHTRIAESLQRQFEGREGLVAEELGHHYFGAERYTTACGHLLFAAERARSVYATREARKLYMVSLFCIDNITQDLELKRRKCDILLRVGEIDTLLGEYEEASFILESAEELAKEIGYKECYPLIQELLGELENTRGNHVGAINHLQKALELYTRMGDIKGISKAFDNIGRIDWKRGKYDEAIRTFMNCLAYIGITHDNVLMARPKIGIANVYTDQGRFQDALDKYNEALGILGDDAPDERARVINNIAVIYEKMGEHKKSIDYFQEAYKIAAKLDAVLIQASCEEGIGKNYISIGDYKKAMEYLEKALFDLMKIENEGGKGIVMLEMGDLHRLKGDYTIALGYYKQALDTFRRLDIPMRLAEAHVGVGLLYEKMGKYAKAERYLSKSLRLYQKLKIKERIAETENALARVSKRLG